MSAAASVDCAVPCGSWHFWEYHSDHICLPKFLGSHVVLQSAYEPNTTVCPRRCRSESLLLQCELLKQCARQVLQPFNCFFAHTTVTSANRLGVTAINNDSIVFTDSAMIEAPLYLKVPYSGACLLFTAWWSPRCVWLQRRQQR